MLGAGAAVVARHRRWLFAVARCRTHRGDVYLKRQPPMGRDARPGGVAAPAREPPGRSRRARRAGAGPRRARRPLVRGARAGRRRGRLRGRRQLGPVRERGARGGRRRRPGPAAPGRRRLPRPPPHSRRPASSSSSTRLPWSRSRPSPRSPTPGRRSPSISAARRGRATSPRRTAPSSTACARSCPGLPAGPASRRLADQQPLLLGRRGERHHRLPPGRLRAPDARPGGRGRAQLLLLEPHLGGRRHRVRSRATRRRWSAPTTPSRRSCRTSARRSPTSSRRCQFEYGISFLDYYWGVERDREKADWAWDTFVLGHARWWESGAGRDAHAAVARIAGAG